MISHLLAEASSENTSPHRLEELAQQSLALARQVAQNPSAPPELLRKLSESKAQTIHQYIAANPFWQRAKIRFSSLEPPASCPLPSFGKVLSHIAHFDRTLPITA